MAIPTDLVELQNREEKSTKMATPIDLFGHQNRKEKFATTILEDLTTRMTQVLSETQTPRPTYHFSPSLDGTNYALWS